MIIMISLIMHMVKVIAGRTKVKIGIPCPFTPSVPVKMFPSMKTPAIKAKAVTRTEIRI